MESIGQPQTPASGWLMISARDAGDVAVKPVAYLPIYEDLLGEMRHDPIALLELGVWKGDSLQMWRDCLPNAHIVGLDLHPPQLDLGPRVAIITGDQTDAALLGRVRAEHAPDGFDVIIDDASHIGLLTAGSLEALYREHLRPGGLYIIEDWGTGYVESWPDGAPLEAPVTSTGLSVGQPADGESLEPRRFPGHDHGMVGVIKRLVDHTASLTLSVHQPDAIEDPLPIAWMRIHDGVVVLKKPSA